MATKRLTIFFAALVAVFMMTAPAPAQDVRSFAVLPFEYNGPEPYKYLTKAFQASLNNDLEWVGHVEPTSSSLSEIKVPNSTAAALTTMKSLGVDYLVTGSITLIGKEASLEIQAKGLDGKDWKQSGKMEIDEITPWLDAQSRAIMGDVFNRPGYSTAEVKKTAPAAAASSGPANTTFIMGENEGQYQASGLNPQFRYEGGTENVGRWRSQTMRYSSYSMIVDDADGDGQNEVIILQKTAISAYRFKEGKLEHLETFDLRLNTDSLRIEGADLDRDGVIELVVGGYQLEAQTGLKAPEGTPRSCILTFKGGKFKYVAERVNRFLGILRIPPTYQPILVAQNKGQRNLFDDRINEAYIKGNDVELGQPIQVPPFGNVYNMAYIPQDLGFNYIVLSNKHKLVTYSQTLERLYESDQTFNSSGIAVAMADKMLGMGPGVTEENKTKYNIPFRMIVSPITDKNKYELLLNKDLSAAASLFEGYTYYTQGEIHSLFWDGVGLNLAWKTRRIKGQVSDIALADLNNDGKKQLCVLINTFAGIGYGNRKTVVLAYDLNM